MILEDVISDVIRFRDERDWAQFDSVRNLIAALNVEAAELLEAVLWLTDSEVQELVQSRSRDKITDEIADVLIYALLLAHALDEDPLQLISKKLEKNADRGQGSFPPSRNSACARLAVWKSPLLSRTATRHG